MGDRLKGKVAIVTGAGGGIGRGHALALASEGAKVVVNDLGGAVDGSGSSSSAASKVVEEIKAAGGEAAANFDSVTTVEGGENIIKTAIDAFGKLDILVNNAGILRDRMVFNMSPEEWDSVIKVHLYGHFNTTRPACVLFRQQRSGRIINTSSTSGTPLSSASAVGVVDTWNPPTDVFMSQRSESVAKLTIATSATSPKPWSIRCSLNAMKLASSASSTVLA